MRVLHPRNKAFTCIRTNHETRDAGAIAKLFAIKLGMRIRRILGSFAVPFFNVWWRNVVIPPTPIVPGDKDDRPRPQPAIHDGLNLLPGPFRTETNVLHGMFAIRRVAIPVDPGDGGQLAFGCLMGKQITAVILRQVGQFADVVKRVTAVVAPSKSRVLQRERE